MSQDDRFLCSLLSQDVLGSYVLMLLHCSGADTVLVRTYIYRGL